MVFGVRSFFGHASELSKRHKRSLFSPLWRAAFILRVGCVATLFFCAGLAARSVYIIAGEASGDRLGAWYLSNYIRDAQERGEEVVVHAIGGEHLARAGAIMLADYHEVSFRLVGIASHFKNISCMWKTWWQLRDRIIREQPDEVVLVDFPFFNVPLGVSVKRACPSLRVTYIAPPELWLWGSFGVHHLLKRAADDVVVLYPSEVSWYRQRGVPARFVGHPLTNALGEYRCETAGREHRIALFPGSRASELGIMLPIFCDVIRIICAEYPDIRFVIPVADERAARGISEFLGRGEQSTIRDYVTIVSDEQEKHAVVARCALAICKPGTCTLEVGLLGIPMVVAFRVPWYTEWFARCTLQSSWVSLPNILLDRGVCPELLQDACTADSIAREALRLYDAFCARAEYYQHMIEELQELWNVFNVHKCKKAEID